MTPEEERANNVQTDAHLQRATQALAAISKKRLTAQQEESVVRIRGFVAQAQEMRATDVTGARSLAERADVLAADLLASLK